MLCPQSPLRSHFDAPRSAPEGRLRQRHLQFGTLWCRLVSLQASDVRPGRELARCVAKKSSIVPAPTLRAGTWAASNCS